MLVLARLAACSERFESLFELGCGASSGSFPHARIQSWTLFCSNMGRLGLSVEDLQLAFGVLHLRYDPMSGLMGVWCAMRPRGLVAVEPGSMLWLLVLLGFVGLGDTLICCDMLWRQVLSAASYIARCLALHSLYNGLSSWVLSLHSKLPGLHRE